jgi:lipoteichoic acid synthase
MIDEPSGGSASTDPQPAEPSRSEPAEFSAATTSSSGASRRPVVAKTPVFFVVLVGLIVVKAWLMRGFALGAWNPLGAAFEAAIVVLLLGIVDIVPPRRWYWLDLFAYTLVSVLLFAITVYVHFYAALFDPHMMAMAGQLGSVTDAIAELVKPVYVLFFVDLPFIALWIVAIRKREKQRRARYAKVNAMPAERRPLRLVKLPGRNWKVAIATAIAAAVFAAQLVSVEGVPSYVDGVAIAKSRGLTIAQAQVFLPKAADDSQDDSNNDVVAPGEKVSSTPTSTSSAAVATATLTPAGKVEARIERIRGSLEGSLITTFSAGAFRGKNVLVIQVEALNTMIVQKKIDGHELTPNLNKLIDQSWYFPNCYSETGIGNTADAEFIMNSSLFAPRSQAASVMYTQYKIPALPRLLNAMNYDTYTMHPNRATYWNRAELYGALGFRRYYDAPFFHWTDIMGFGPSDEVLFSKAMVTAKQDDKAGTPFYAQYITLSSHTPFEYVPQSRRPVKTPSEYSGSMLGNYMSAESYTDMAIGKFIANLKAAGIWDKSIVVIYGDHTSMLDNSLDGKDAKAAKALLGREYGAADRQRIPLIIHLPGQTEGDTRQDTVGQVDIMPTIADLVGVDLTQVPHMGKSVFVNSNALVPFNSYLPGGSFANDRVVFMPGLGFDDGTAVNIADDSDAKATDVEQNDYERMLELTRLSDKWVTSLPKRSDRGNVGDAWIPNEAARKAGQKFGVTQEGIGSGDN